MKIKYITDGGFNKSGGFVENEDNGSDENKIYERQGYLGVTIKCRDILIVNDIVSHDYSKDTVQRRISATGDFEPARWGKWRLSLLGSKQTHNSISIHIQEGLDKNEFFTAGGSPASDANDIDLDFDETFYIEVILSPVRFSHLIDQLSNSPCDLILYVRFGAFPRFLATWSPSISEGRIIKYLSDSTNVENGDDIPEDYFKKANDDGGLFDDSPPVSMFVTKPVETLHKKPLDDDHWHEEEDGYGKGQKVENSNLITAQAISKLESAIASTTSKIGLWLIILIIAILVAGIFK